MQELSQRLESCRIECKDIEEEIALIEEKTTVSPKRLEEVENRLSLIYDTLRRYECRDETELTAYKQRLQEELEVSENDLQEYAKLKREESSMEICRNEAAVKLSAKRKAVYSKLAKLYRKPYGSWRCLTQYLRYSWRAVRILEKTGQIILISSSPQTVMIEQMNSQKWLRVRIIAHNALFKGNYGQIYRNADNDIR